jgi:hypothetical protein
MRRDFWSLGVPFETLHLSTSAEPTGRADFFLGMERDLATTPAGDMGHLVHLSH